MTNLAISGSSRKAMHDRGFVADLRKMSKRVMESPTLKTQIEIALDNCAFPCMLSLPSSPLPPPRYSPSRLFVLIYFCFLQTNTSTKTWILALTRRCLRSLKMTKTTKMKSKELVSFSFLLLCSPPLHLPLLILSSSLFFSHLTNLQKGYS